MNLFWWFLNNVVNYAFYGQILVAQRALLNETMSRVSHTSPSGRTASVYLGMMPDESVFSLDVPVVVSILGGWEMSYAPAKPDASNATHIKLRVPDEGSLSATEMLDAAEEVARLSRSDGANGGIPFVHCRWGRGRSQAFAALLLLVMTEDQETLVSDILDTVKREAIFPQSVNQTQRDVLEQAALLLKLRNEPFDMATPTT